MYKYVCYSASWLFSCCDKTSYLCNMMLEGVASWWLVSVVTTSNWSQKAVLLKVSCTGLL